MKYEESFLILRFEALNMFQCLISFEAQNTHFEVTFQRALSEDSIVIQDPPVWHSYLLRGELVDRMAKDIECQRFSTQRDLKGQR